MADPILAALLALAGMTQPGIVSRGDLCARESEGRYDWRIVASAGRLSLSAEDIADFITHVAAEGVDTQGRFQLSLVSQGGLREIRITPPLIGFYGIPASYIDRAGMELYLLVGDTYLQAPQAAGGYFVLDGASLGILETNPYTGLRPQISLALVSEDRVLVSATIKTFLLEAGLEQWDEQAEALRSEGCLRL